MRSVFQFSIGIFPKIRYFLIGKYQEIPKFRDNTEKINKKTALVTLVWMFSLASFHDVRRVPGGLGGGCLRVPTISGDHIK